MGLLRRADGVEVFESSDADVDEWPERRLPGSYRTGCSIPGNLLNEGRYTLTIYFLIPDVRFFAHIQDALTFDVVDLGARGSEVAAMQERRGVDSPRTRLDAVKGNMSRTRTAVRNLLPRVVVQAVRRARGARLTTGFHGDFQTWAAAAAEAGGYYDPSILDKTAKAASKVKNGTAAFERDSVLFDEIQYSWPVLAGLLWAASSGGNELNVLDFGGSLGTSYFQNRGFLQHVAHSTLEYRRASSLRGAWPGGVRDDRAQILRKR